MAQDNKSMRASLFAGQFYPADSSALHKLLEKEFNQIVLGPSNQRVRALIVPHAGYVYSGQTAAYGFATLREKNDYKNVFILGSSHVAAFDGASVFDGLAFETPLGQIPINTEIATELRLENIFSFPPSYHIEEHCIEVELPFLQFILKPGFKIIPITIGTKNKHQLTQIAEKLRPWFTNENLFIISTDLSHYPSYPDAVKADNLVIQAILSGNEEKFSNAVRANENAEIENYMTAICGYSAVDVLLNLTNGNPAFTFEKLKYTNSGDISGDFSRVVGYTSISVREQVVKTNTSIEELFVFGDDDKAQLFAIARGSIEARLNNSSYSLPDSLPAILTRKCGVFVTLHSESKLRGCIGTFRQDQTLVQNVKEMACSAAFSDPRFEPLTAIEYKNIDLEISILTPMKRIDSIQQIIPGKHGIYIKKGNQTGTYLPQVATEQGWTLEEFLGHCCRDKVGIGYEGWKESNVEIYIYETIIIQE
jgi:hypothetical protein